MIVTGSISMSLEYLFEVSFIFTWSEIRLGWQVRKNSDSEFGHLEDAVGEDDLTQSCRTGNPEINMLELPFWLRGVLKHTFTPVAAMLTAWSWWCSCPGRGCWWWFWSPRWGGGVLRGRIWTCLLWSICSCQCWGSLPSSWKCLWLLQRWLDSWWCQPHTLST